MAVGVAVGIGVAIVFSSIHPRNNNDIIKMKIEISFLLVIPHQITIMALSIIILSIYSLIAIQDKALLTIPYINPINV